MSHLKGRSTRSQVERTLALLVESGVVYCIVTVRICRILYDEISHPKQVLTRYFKAAIMAFQAARYYNFIAVSNPSPAMRWFSYIFPIIMDGGLMMIIVSLISVMSGNCC